MRRRGRPTPAAALGAILLTLAACERTPTRPESFASPTSALAVDAPSLARGERAAEGGPTAGDREAEGGFEVVPADFSGIDAGLLAVGLAARVATVEYVTIGESGRIGRLLLASDRGNKRLIFDWVPGDPRRGGDPEITYAVDAVDGAANGGVTSAQTEAAIDRALATWGAVRCSDRDLAIQKVASLGLDLGIVQLILGFGGSPFLVADIAQAGWLPPAFFGTPPFFPPDGGTFIVGATFTAGFVDADGNFVDADGDGRLDAAFREIYYNDRFPWGIDADALAIDVETVALHESGHGLSQEHFGDIFLTPSNGKLQFAPRAVMNAAIAGRLQALTGTDIAGHCANWGSWPNR